MEKPMSGYDIEKRSFEIIDREIPAHNFSAEQWQVARRMIHTVGDPGILDDILFSPDAITSAVEALREGRPIYTDTNMIRSGISMSRLKEACPDYGSDRVICSIADADILDESKKTGLPRSLLAIRKARHMLTGAIVLFGNSPVGLMELSRMVIEEGVKPVFIGAVPVGFVHVVESKEEVTKLGIPCIALRGRKGGSAVAVSILHALVSLARGSDAVVGAGGAAEKPCDAVILMGHGSRVPGADSGMEEVARGIGKRFENVMVRTCSMSMLGPRFGEVLKECVADGVKKVVVIPYFLHYGAHMKEDIPAILFEKACLYPSVRIIMGKNLGFDEKLIDLVVKRIRESESLDDIRKVYSGANQ
jgi:cobalt/nickel transport system ATP-binding protein/precorrin-8X/cobalt-precorrin-8 methylmutase